MRFISFVPRIHKNKVPLKQISNIGIKSTQSLLKIKYNSFRLIVLNLYSRKKNQKQFHTLIDFKNWNVIRAESPVVIGRVCVCAPYLYIDCVYHSLSIYSGEI